MEVNSFQAQSNEFCCGIVELGDFGSDRRYWDFDFSDKDDIAHLNNYYAFIHASFIDTEDCKKAYLEMCKKFTKIYQSPVRKNPGTKNTLFMCVFIPKEK